MASFRHFLSFRSQAPMRAMPLKPTRLFTRRYGGLPTLAADDCRRRVFIRLASWQDNIHEQSVASSMALSFRL